MLTTRMSPKISENPLATMNRSPANVSASSRVRRKAPGSSIAEPKFVVRQLPPNVDGLGDHEHVQQRRRGDRCSGDAKRDQLRAAGVRRQPDRSPGIIRHADG